MSVAAPEQISNEYYSLPSDVYQLGQLFGMLLNENFQFIGDPEVLRMHGDEYVKLVGAMFERDAEKRPTIGEVEATLKELQGVVAEYTPNIALLL